MVSLRKTAPILYNYPVDEPTLHYIYCCAIIVALDQTCFEKLDFHNRRKKTIYIESIGTIHFQKRIFKWTIYIWGGKLKSCQ